MRPQKHGTPAFTLAIDPQGVPHVAGGVVGRDAEGLEVVVVPLDLGPFCHLEPHDLKRAQNILQSLGDWVEAAPWQRWPGQRYVEPLAFRYLSDAVLFETSKFLSVSGFKTQFDSVRLSP